VTPDEARERRVKEIAAWKAEEAVQHGEDYCQILILELLARMTLPGRRKVFEDVREVERLVRGGGR